MKKRFLRNTLFLLLFTANIYAQTYNFQNISLVSNWFDSTVVAEPVFGIKYNGIWGWHDGNGREYGIIGATKGTYIVEVTNPANPQLRDFIPGIQTGCIWRELKTYGNYLYMVSDDPSPNGLQIADLSYLPDSVHLVHSSDTIINRCHTIFVDGNKLYGGGPSGGAVGNGAAMAVYSLANPEAPQLLRKLGQDVPSVSYVHDMFVRNDTIYASAANQGLYIFGLQANNTFTSLGSITSYPDQGYNHSSALSDDGSTLVFCDEVPGGLSVKSFDVSNFSNLQFKSTFESHADATPHNPFSIGNDLMAIAYYKDGLWIFNTSNPASVVLAGYFDTYWQNDSCVCYNDTPTDYAGCWGAYPYLPSGNMLASDMQNGLFVLDISTILGNPDLPFTSGTINADPNPFSGNLNLSFNLIHSQEVTWFLFDITGRLVVSETIQANKGKSAFVINASELTDGIYTLKVAGKHFNEVKKVVKSR